MIFRKTLKDEYEIRIGVLTKVTNHFIDEENQMTKKF